MRHTTKQLHANRTITIDFQNEATYFQLLGDGKAFVEFVIALPCPSAFSSNTRPPVAGADA
jgi:hypothetical protein